MNIRDLLPLLQAGLDRLDAVKAPLGHFQTPESPGLEHVEAALTEYVARLSQNYPFSHPAYVGQMLKPPHPAAWLAYTLAMTVNPNNHALDGGPDASHMEKEVIAEFRDFFGFPDATLGHLTASGTIANLEALWVARCCHPGKAIAYSAGAHYTHQRMSAVLGMNSLQIPTTLAGEIDWKELEQRAPEIGTLVVTLGTTAEGRIEPLHHLLPFCRKHGIRVHVDAAYGGFFRAIAGSQGMDAGPWLALSQADSLVVDPHKHGLQPYGCGAVLFADPAVGAFYKHDSPYTYFTSDDLHLGEISLECSRAGAAAAALWFTLKLLPLNPGPEQPGFRDVVGTCRTTALQFSDELERSKQWRLVSRPELDIVCYFPEVAGGSMAEISRRSRAIMQQGMTAPDSDRIYLSLCRLTPERLAVCHPDLIADTQEVFVLRSVMMKPEHQTFLPELVRRLNHAAASVG